MTNVFAPIQDLLQVKINVNIKKLNNLNNDNYILF